MALFDFLKKKKEIERTASPEHDHDHAHDEVAHADVHKNRTQIAAAENFVLIAPHVTERARMLAEIGQYTFRIQPDATKRDVKHSVERMYKVHVENIQIVKAHEKPRRRGLTEGVKKGYKKAVVALREGEAIDIF